MLLGFNQPTAITWSIAGTGASFISSPSVLTNGRTADRCRIQWLSSQPRLTDTVTLTVQTTDSSLITGVLFGILSIYYPTTGKFLNLKCTVIPAGNSIQSLGGNTNDSHQAQTGPDGVSNWWAYSTSAPNSTGLQFVIANDNGGLTPPIARSDFLDIGEIWFGSSATFSIGDNFKNALADPSIVRKSHNNQTWPIARKPYRVYSGTIVPTLQDSDVFGGSASMQAIRYGMSTGSIVAMAPKYLNRGYPGASNATFLAQSAILGSVSAPIAINAQTGSQYWSADIQVDEVPG